MIRRTRSYVFYTLAILALATCDASSPNTCAFCVVAVAMVEQLAVVHNSSVAAELETACLLFPAGAVRTGCDALLASYAPELIRLLEGRLSADVVCHAMNACDGTCHLFPPPPEGIVAEASAAKQNSSLVADTFTGPPAICKLPGMAQLCKIIFGFADDNLPVEDADGDGFSSYTATLRGTDWRGKDCAPSDPRAHPGAKPIDDDRLLDSNCNGIFGVNPATGVPYETELCGGTAQHGVVVLGDSASAHFHIPPEFLTPAEVRVRARSRVRTRACESLCVRAR